VRMTPIGTPIGSGGTGRTARRTTTRRRRRRSPWSADRHGDGLRQRGPGDTRRGVRVHGYQHQPALRRRGTLARCQHGEYPRTASQYHRLVLPLAEGHHVHRCARVQQRGHVRIGQPHRDAHRVGVCGDAASQRSSGEPHVGDRLPTAQRRCEQPPNHLVHRVGRTVGHHGVRKGLQLHRGEIECGTGSQVPGGDDDRHVDGGPGSGAQREGGGQQHQQSSRGPAQQHGS
jgi:hypothetical protein